MRFYIKDIVKTEIGNILVISTYLFRAAWVLEVLDELLITQRKSLNNNTKTLHGIDGNIWYEKIMMLVVLIHRKKN